MPSKKNDISILRGYIASIKLKHIVIFFLTVIGLVILNIFVGVKEPDHYGPDYKKVANNFIFNSMTISQKLGKIQSVSHIGVGGASGKVSYNFYSIRGEESSGNCHVTLKKEENDLWYVDSATLLSRGREYNVPVKTSRVGEKRFKFFFQ